jgi:hypothetical protein
MPRHSCPRPKNRERGPHADGIIGGMQELDPTVVQEAGFRPWRGHVTLHLWAADRVHHG